MTRGLFGRLGLLGSTRSGSATAHPGADRPGATHPAADRLGADRVCNRRRSGRQVTARRSVLWFGAVLAVIHLGVAAALDHTRPGIRDPEYGRRVDRLRARLAENPGRPSIVLIGSSRAAMGVRPDAWEAVRSRQGGPPAPLLFNMSLLGSGPVMELLLARRVYADGLRPDVVLFEYWPPYLYSEREWAEPDRIAAERLSPRDRAVVRDYFPEPEKVEARLRRHWCHPIYANRYRLLVQFAPRWVPKGHRIDWTWDNLDDWGWKPGFDFEPGFTPERAAMLDRCRGVYKTLFDAYRIHPNADRALRAAVATARAYGARVGLVFLPESSEFRGWYTAEAERLARDHLRRITEDLGLPVLDTRNWMPDEYFVDGFHLSRAGAAEFTRRFGPVVAERFAPDGVRP
jgi:hypothetical protein